MARSLVVVTFALAALATVCLRVHDVAAATTTRATVAPPLAAGRLIVVLSPSAQRGTEVAAALAQRHALDVQRTWHIDSLARDCFEFLTRGAREPAKLLARVRADPAVESVQFAVSYAVAGTRTGGIDPYINLQHSLLEARIEEAHQITTGKGVKVAIIDTGLDRSHEDLRHRIENTLNFVDADQTIEIVEFHATAVAGILGAESNNGRGIVGIAPDSELYSLRACSESIPGTSRGQCSSFALARALDWAISNDMKVVNMSLQGEYDPLVARLIVRAIERGLVVVAATEINDVELTFPASMNEVIAVSYHDPTRALDYTRNAGRVFVAPGEEILTTMPNNTYDFVSGSSFASAHIAGIVALLAERVPNIDSHTVKAVLRTSTRIANWTVLIDTCTALGTLTGIENCRFSKP